ncbi:hypothetical protein PoB_002896500 [Plakobranchus ocellatus]|uniref:Uncharacterized protein n=1 Tax=Plakobranchus ocellatus TaxID=259542 RepID=A0AAV4A6M8_9GAST|nr:hypothetical protein PoB_002896500 [Plakobranchus ocellatus]
MKLISAFVAAAFVATALGADDVEFCELNSYKTESFDAVNFVPVITIYDSTRRVSLHRTNLPDSTEFRLLDFVNGRVYISSDDGTCVYFENEDVQAYGGSAPAGLKPQSTVESPNSEPISTFQIPAGDVEFRILQRGQGDSCRSVLFSLFVDTVPRLAYFHSGGVPADAYDLAEVTDALNQVQNAGCMQRTL